MNVLMINGSPKPNGNTAIALHEMEQIFVQEGIQVETVHVGKKNIRGCIGCNKCMEAGKCVFDDLVNETAPKFEACDGLVVGTPVYYASANGTLVSFLDRLFYAGSSAMRYKPAAIAVIARRGGCTSAFDAMLKYPTYNQMPVVSGDYWPIAHAHVDPAQLRCDEEGLFTLSTLARNMAWMLRCIEAGKKAGIQPEYVEKNIWTNFIR